MEVILLPSTFHMVNKLIFPEQYFPFCILIVAGFCVLLGGKKPVQY